MTTPTGRIRRPATRSRWAATGLSAAVTVGTVAAMADAAESEAPEQALTEAGTNLGAVARHEADVAAAALMSAADPGAAVTVPSLPPRLGRAHVS